MSETMSKNANQPPLRKVVDKDRGLELEPREVEAICLEARKYAQSTSERSSSQVTTPPDSRSMLIESDSPQDFTPYAKLFRCPTVDSQRAANASRSSDDIE